MTDTAHNVSELETLNVDRLAATGDVVTSKKLKYNVAMVNAQGIALDGTSFKISDHGDLSVYMNDEIVQAFARGAWLTIFIASPTPLLTPTQAVRDAMAKGRRN